MNELIEDIDINIAEIQKKLDFLKYAKVVMLLHREEIHNQIANFVIKNLQKIIQFRPIRTDSDWMDFCEDVASPSNKIHKLAVRINRAICSCMTGLTQEEEKYFCNQFDVFDKIVDLYIKDINKAILGPDPEDN